MFTNIQCSRNMNIGYLWTNGAGNYVRKDAVAPDGTAVIIEPKTKSGEKSAKKDGDSYEEK